MNITPLTIYHSLSRQDKFTLLLTVADNNKPIKNKRAFLDMMRVIHFNDVLMHEITDFKETGVATSEIAENSLEYMISYGLISKEEPYTITESGKKVVNWIHENDITFFLCDITNIKRLYN